MTYGCIGEHLRHSFSKEIHGRLADYEYEIKEIPPQELAAFTEAKDFRAVNVTIPYKELIIPYLHDIDAHAKNIGAVNTVVNRGGKLYGYNTDFYGISALIEHIGVTPRGKKVIITGTGGTSKTAEAVCRHYGARSIIKASRSGKDGACTYPQIYAEHTDAEFVLNTTPVGMFPEIHDTPLDISKFPRLAAVVDTVYNPLRTTLVSKALQMGIAAEGGLYMLVAQAVRASEIFLDIKYPEGTLDRVFREMLREKENIVLVGMPASGKTTVGALLAQITGRQVTDTDDTVCDMAGKSIPEIFANEGEAAFRDMEARAVMEAAAVVGGIISTGGGAVLRPENVAALKKNGRVYFIDRPCEKLTPTATRPLSSDREAMRKRYNERYPIYRGAADVTVDADRPANEVALAIWKDFTK